MEKTATKVAKFKFHLNLNTFNKPIIGIVLSFLLVLFNISVCKVILKFSFLLENAFCFFSLPYIKSYNVGYMS